MEIIHNLELLIKLMSKFICINYCTGKYIKWDKIYPQCAEALDILRVMPVMIKGWWDKEKIVAHVILQGSAVIYWKTWSFLSRVLCIRGT